MKVIKIEQRLCHKMTETTVWVWLTVYSFVCCAGFGQSCYLMQFLCLRWIRSVLLSVN